MRREVREVLLRRSEVIKWRQNYSISKETLPKGVLVEVVSRTVCRRSCVVIVAVVVEIVEKIRGKADHVSRRARTDRSSIISVGSARDSVGNVAKALSRYFACSCPSRVHRDPPWGRSPLWSREENRTREGWGGGEGGRGRKGSTHRKEGKRKREKEKRQRE